MTCDLKWPSGNGKGPPRPPSSPAPGALVPTYKCLSALPCPLKPLLPGHSPAGQQWASDLTWVDISLPQDGSEMGADHRPLSHGRSCQSSERLGAVCCAGRVGRQVKRQKNSGDSFQHPESGGHRAPALPQCCTDVRHACSGSPGNSDRPARRRA